MTVLSTFRLILRPWREADREPFARLNDDPAVMEFMPRRLSRDESDAQSARAQAEIEQRGWGLWAVEVKDGASSSNCQTSPAALLGAHERRDFRSRFIGFVGLSVPTFDAHFTPCVEIGWRLAREHWGRGYASEAAEEGLRFAFENLSLLQVVSFTVPSNSRSRRVMERIGMSRDLAGDFDHPRVAPSSPLRPHVLYRINRDAWLRRCWIK